ncbi:MAG: hypothetical protein VXX04_01110, partial [Actinomycetota bacterium]|nr:hypothetical protein [Actinomycetota bacterium]
MPEHPPRDAQVVLLGVGVVLRPVLVPGLAEERALGRPRVGKRDNDVFRHEGAVPHRIAELERAVKHRAGDGVESLPGVDRALVFEEEGRAHEGDAAGLEQVVDRVERRVRVRDARLGKAVRLRVVLDTRFGQGHGGRGARRTRGKA